MKTEPPQPVPAPHVRRRARSRAEKRTRRASARGRFVPAVGEPVLRGRRRHRRPHRRARRARSTPAALAALAHRGARASCKLRHAPLLLLDVLCSAPARAQACVARHGGARDPARRRDGRAPRALLDATARGRFRRQMKQRPGQGVRASSTPISWRSTTATAAVKLRDVLRLVHPKPADDGPGGAVEAASSTARLPSPDTWEVALSGGADKKETFERLLARGASSATWPCCATCATWRRPASTRRWSATRSWRARARRPRAAVPLRGGGAGGAAVRAGARRGAVGGDRRPCRQLAGRTVVLVDVSGSMDAPLSRRSDLTPASTRRRRWPRSCRGDVRVLHVLRTTVVEGAAAPRHGGRRRDRSVAAARRHLARRGASSASNKLPHDRLIVITDEQSHDPVGAPVARHAYMINVASAQNGVGYGEWTHIDGSARMCWRFIHAHEADVGR